MTQETSPLKAAICEFKKKGITIKKEDSNPFFKSKYASLPTILDAVETEAAKCGLVIISALKSIEGAFILETVLEHKDSDESRVSVFPVFGSKPQEIGSSITYARRYNIQSLLNLAAEDDDGNEANKAAPVKDPAAPKRALYIAIMNEFDTIKDSEDLDSMMLSRTDDMEIIRKYSKEGFDKLKEREAALRATFKDMGA